MNVQFSKSFSLPALVVLMQVLGSPVAAAGAPEACKLLSPSEVAKITGEAAPIFTNSVEPTVSGCTYTANQSGSMQASVSVGFFESSSKAQERLKMYGDLESYKKLLKPGDTIESDKVAGLPAVFQIVRGVANMFVVKGNMVIAAGVNRVWSDGKTTPDRERSRALLAAALGKL